MECVTAPSDDTAVYDALLDLFAESADAERGLAFRLSLTKQERLAVLLDKNRERHSDARPHPRGICHADPISALIGNQALVLMYFVP